MTRYSNALPRSHPGVSPALMASHSRSNPGHFIFLISASYSSAVGIAASCRLAFVSAAIVVLYHAGVGGEADRGELNLSKAGIMVRDQFHLGTVLLRPTPKR